MAKMVHICGHCGVNFGADKPRIGHRQRFCSRKCGRAARKRLPVKERFDKLWVPEPMSGCWLWLAAVKPDTPQRGVFQLGETNTSAPRASWFLYKGEIPKGMSILHRCDNALCVNPDHLFLGTQRDNMTDMVEKGRSAKGAANGSAKLTDENVIAIRASAASHIDLARKFGVADSVIVRVRQRKIWRHV